MLAMLRTLGIIVVALLTPILLGQASVLWINRQSKNSSLFHNKEPAKPNAKENH
jgi:hypothetical protein